MIGLTILGGIALYLWLTTTIVGKVYSKTQSITKKRIAIAIFILIPTWDVILGYPIYWYLCATQSGAKIYKTVDNVNDICVGELLKNNNSMEPSYRCCEFISYQYNQNGECISEKWIPKNDVLLVLDINRKITHFAILYFDVYRVEFLITDRKSHKAYMYGTNYFVDKSWISGVLNAVSNEQKTMNCSTNSRFNIGKNFITIDYLSKGDK